MPDPTGTEWTVRVTATCASMLREISDDRIRRKLVETIGELRSDPGLKGKALLGELAGFRSIRAVGQRYRILYQVERHDVVVYVVAAGIRKEGDRSDIYRLAQRLVRLGLLAPADEDDKTGQ